MNELTDSQAVYFEHAISTMLIELGAATNPIQFSNRIVQCIIDITQDVNIAYLMCPMSDRRLEKKIITSCHYTLGNTYTDMITSEFNTYIKNLPSLICNKKSLLEQSTSPIQFETLGPNSENKNQIELYDSFIVPFATQDPLHLTLDSTPRRLEGVFHILLKEDATPLTRTKKRYIKQAIKMAAIARLQFKQIYESGFEAAVAKWLSISDQQHDALVRFTDSHDIVQLNQSMRTLLNIDHTVESIDLYYLMNILKTEQPSLHKKLDTVIENKQIFYHQTIHFNGKPYELSVICLDDDTPETQRGGFILFHPILQIDGNIPALLNHNLEKKLLRKQPTSSLTEASPTNTDKDANHTTEDLNILDPLTGLFNREQIYLIVERTQAAALRYHRQFAFLFMDIDAFKAINDRYGHDVGDRLLIAFANRLRKYSRESDCLGRMGGDEFAIIIPSIKAPIDPGKYATKILKLLSFPFAIAEHEVQISASIGIACYPLGPDNASSIFKKAHLALQQAKKNGKNRLQYFTETLNNSYNKRVALESKLKLAICNHEIFLNYIPRIALATGKVVGLEAIAKWHHPDLGVIEPHQFLPIAESTGFINELGMHILELACEQFSFWQHHYLHDTLFSFVVNISPYQLKEKDFSQKALDMLKKYKMPLSKFECQLSDTDEQAHAAYIKETLVQLNHKQIQFSLAGFGTGHAALTQLSSLPISVIKIAPTFIANIGENKLNDAIVTSTITLARHSGIKVIAEGVSTKKQVDFLTHHDCLEAQGEYFSLPLDEEKVTEILSNFDESYIQS